MVQKAWPCDPTSALGLTLVASPGRCSLGSNVRLPNDKRRVVLLLIVYKEMPQHSKARRLGANAVAELLPTQGYMVPSHAISMFSSLASVLLQLQQVLELGPDTSKTRCLTCTFLCHYKGRTSHAMDPCREQAWLHWLHHLTASKQCFGFHVPIPLFMKLTWCWKNEGSKMCFFFILFEKDSLWVAAVSFRECFFQIEHHLFFQ